MPTIGLPVTRSARQSKDATFDCRRHGAKCARQGSFLRLKCPTRTVIANEGGRLFFAPHVSGEAAVPCHDSCPSLITHHSIWRSRRRDEYTSMRPLLPIALEASHEVMLITSD